jgi:hypothetical protein
MVLVIGFIKLGKVQKMVQMIGILLNYIGIYILKEIMSGEQNKINY